MNILKEGNKENEFNFIYIKDYITYGKDTGFLPWKFKFSSRSDASVKIKNLNHKDLKYLYFSQIISNVFNTRKSPRWTSEDLTTKGLNMSHSHQAVRK